MKNIVFNDYTGDINELILATADHEGTDVEKFAYEIDWFYQNSGGVYDTYIGDVGVGGERVPAKIVGLAAWVDAYTSPESIDSANGVKTIRCKKTNNQLVAPDIVAETSTLRPVYDAANKEIVFTAANSQKLSKNGFFTAEPFKSATKGMGQAYSIIFVGSTYPSFSIGAYACGYWGNFLRAGVSASYGGAMYISDIATKSIVSLIKPAATNPLKLFDTFSTISPYPLNGNVPIPILYKNSNKLANSGTVYDAINNGNALSSGIFELGSYLYIYMNMRINEFLVYDNAISEADLLLLIAHLKAKWGIA